MELAKIVIGHLGMKLAGGRPVLAQEIMVLDRPETNSGATTTIDGVAHGRQTSINVAMWTETTRAIDHLATAVEVEVEAEALHEGTARHILEGHRAGRSSWKEYRWTY